jgi:hypothetical protein
MKQLLSTLAFLCCALFAMAQTANVQVIHNSPTPGTNSGPTVDIYVNGNLLAPLTGVPFRAATGFLPVPSGVDITVDVKVSPSTPADPNVGSFDLGQLADGANYVVTANGIAGDMMNPFQLSINGAAQTAANDGSKVAFAALHGSPGAPAVDIDARTVGNLFSDVSFTEYTNYVEVDPGVYYIDVRGNGSPDILATFEANLNGLAGGAATVFASGILGDTPAFGLFAALADGTVVELPATEIARAQIIHNSPINGTGSGPTVDIYVNGGLLVPGLEFRTATEFVFVPAGVALDIAVVPAGGDPVNDDVYGGDPVTLDNGATYVLTANGIAGNPVNPFTIDINAMAREAATDAGNVDLSVLHGSPGAPSVDVDARAIGTLITDLEYGEYTSDYLSVDPGVYYLDIRVTGSPDIVATFQADLNGLAGGAATVFASGILGDTPAFGLFAALADGTVVELPATEIARAQIIHNSPINGTGSGPTVDIYVNGGLLVPGFEFRTATEFVFVPAGVALDIAVVPAGGDPVNDDVYGGDPVTLDNGATYVLTANGIAGNPVNPFTLHINAMAREAAENAGTVDLSVLHGSPGAPNVDVDARAVGTLITDLEFGEYNGYLTVLPEVYYLDVRVAGSPDIVATFEADLNGLAGGAATVFASGILGDTPAFGLFAALADGTVVELPATSIARLQLIHNSPGPGTATGPAVDIYANGDLLLENFEFRTATGFDFVPGDVAIDLSVVPTGGDPVNDNLYTGGPVTFENGSNYVVVANGIAGDAINPFTLDIQDMAREGANNSNEIDIDIHHGSPELPPVDIDIFGVVTGDVVDGLAYGDFSGYVSVPGAPYFITVDAGLAALTYYLNTEGLEGSSWTVFASGLFTNTPGLGIFAANQDGDVIELQLVDQFAEANVIHNSPAAAADVVDVYLNGGRLLDDFEFRTATGFTELAAGIPLSIGIAPGNSTSVADTIFNLDLAAGLAAGENYVITAAGIPGDADNPLELQIFAGAKQAADNAGEVELLALHSSPGAPNVDIDARAVGNLISDLEYGEYNGYLAVAPQDYYLDVKGAGSPDIVETFLAPLGGFADQALTVFASGILGGSPAFGLFAADADGNVVELPISRVIRGQIIHNSPSPTVDIYLDDVLAIEDLAFRDATEFTFLPAETLVNVKVVPADGDPAMDAVYDENVSFDFNGDTYIIMATGIAGDMDNPFELALYNAGREAAAGTGVDLLAYHGSTDAPVVDVVVEGPGSILFDDLEYGNFSDEYANVPADIYNLAITPGDDNDNTVRRYIADVTGLEGGAAVVFATGFLSDDDPAFGLWVALPDGTTFPLQDVSAVANLNGNLNSFGVAPNPGLSGQEVQVAINLNNATQARVELRDLNGRLVQPIFTGMLPSGGQTFTVDLPQLQGGMYLIQLTTDAGIAVQKLVIGQ